MLKQTLIAGAALLLAAAPALAFHHSGNYTKTVTVAHVDNTATVTNNVYSVSNTGLNFTGSNGGTTQANVTTGETERAHGGNVTGGTAMGGASSTVVTGNAGSSSSVTNVVNTTVVRQ